MDCDNVSYFTDSPYSKGGAVLIDSDEGHVAVHGVEPEAVVRMFRNFVCAKHNNLFDLEKDSYAVDAIKEIAEGIRAYYEIKNAPERRELFKPCKD